jgi:hypothetical protein
LPTKISKGDLKGKFDPLFEKIVMKKILKEIKILS